MASDVVVTLTDASFKEAQGGDKPLLVDFWAEWCGPCKMLTPIVEELAGELQDKLTVGKMDVDANPQTAQAYGIMSIPSLLVFKNGEVVKTLVGYMSKKDLLSKLADVL